MSTIRKETQPAKMNGTSNGLKQTETGVAAEKIKRAVQERRDFDLMNRAMSGRV